MVIGVFIKGLSALAKRVAKNKAKNLKKAKGVIKAKRKEANKAVQARKKVTPVGGQLVGKKAQAQAAGVRDTINTLRSKIKNKEALRRNRNAKKVI